MVGSSLSAKENTKRLAKELGKNGIIVISGLEKGIGNRIYYMAKKVC